MPFSDVLQAKQEMQAQEAECRAAAQMHAAAAAAARQSQLQQLLRQRLELQVVSSMQFSLQGHFLNRVNCLTPLDDRHLLV